MNTIFNKKLARRHDAPYIRTAPHPVKALIVAFIIVIGLSACSVNTDIGIQGHLTDADGNPLNGKHIFIFSYWDCPDPADGSCKMLYEESAAEIEVVNGLFNYPVGPSDPVVYVQPLWLEIKIDGETLAPRQRLLGSPYAMTLVGGAIVGSGHTGQLARDNTTVDYASLTVAAIGEKGTAFAIVAAENGGDLVRACTGITSISRTCNVLRFQVTNDGDVKASGTITGGGADFAEWIQQADPQQRYEPGDLLVISRTQDRAVSLSTMAYDPGLIGVYSTKPTMIGGGDLVADGSAGYVPVAITGIVPVKVSAENGPIRRGDWLTSAQLPGYAMRADAHQPGAMLGKALGELEAGTGMIEVLLLVQ